MSEAYDIRVTIREEFKKDMIFNLQARPPIGIILGYVGYQYEVIPMLQSLSHCTQAYIVNADGLPGFVNMFDFIRFFRTMDEAG